MSCDPQTNKVICLCPDYRACKGADVQLQTLLCSDDLLCRRFIATLKFCLKSNARTSHVMFRLASVFAVTLLSLCWQVPVESVYVDIPVQLAVLGDDYFAFGSINGDVQENVRYAVMLCWT